MADKREKAKISLAYRIEGDGTYEIRINHIGMPHKDEVESSACDICRFLTRRFQKLHSEIFHLTLNRGLFEQPKLVTAKVIEPTTPKTEIIPESKILE